MKRTTLFVALASALSLSAYAHDQSSKQSSQSDETQQQSAAAGQSQQNPDLVKQAQEKLSAAGKDVGTPDGKMGPKTQAALKDFQQEKGLQASGQLDHETLAALDIDQDSSAATGGTSDNSPSSSGPSNPQGNDTGSTDGSTDNSASPAGQSGKY